MQASRSKHTGKQGQAGMGKHMGKQQPDTFYAGHHWHVHHVLMENMACYGAASPREVP